MARTWDRDHVLAALLLAFIGLIAFLQLVVDPGLFPWAGYSVLAELIASALLPLRLTFVVGVADLGAVAGVYGAGVQGVPTRDRFITVLAVFLAFVVSLVVCRLREKRDRRLRNLTISRARLRLLSEAGRRVGSTLDVSRTAAELADVAVVDFADLARVDLVATREPFAAPVTGAQRVFPAASRAGPTAGRSAGQSAGPSAGPSGSGSGSASAGPSAGSSAGPSAWSSAGPGGTPPGLGEPMTYPESESSGPASCLATGNSVLSQDPATTATWFTPQADDPAEAGEAAGPTSAMAIALRARRGTLGVVLFGRLGTRPPFDEDDVLLAEEIASRAAVCIDNARRYTRERETALALQRSLLPQEMPSLMAVETHSRYLPADSAAGVGGDWFDVIPLSGARVALIVGDVAGHGIQASATMGRLRTAVRTLADIELTPDELLTRLDGIVLHRTAGARNEIADTDLSATCLYAVYDPVTCECTVARAGHAPPVVRHPDGTVGLLDAPAGPPLGVGGLPFESATAHVPAGSLVVLYTDGLIESYDHDIDEGLDLLRAALRGTNPSMSDAADQILRSLLPNPPRDDVALLIARTRALGADRVAGWQLPSAPAAVAQARKYATDQLTGWGMGEDVEFATELIVSELVTNAVRYATGPISLRLINGDSLICEVSDGSNTSPHLRLAAALDEGGRGLFLIARTSERWGTRRTSAGKTIWAELSLS
ncbi:SpoIIE family protein phosphatase [Streptomyces sp. SID3212]|uniref:ATP-binding SpoIIE family protein phosphatase n=1 Tax=Streptomyces sp. SID3212 TaxID=2690259 RepID=UPI001F001803|nr:SpoIIE family protein phosphatase [Streptomyces sp. SID3212]